MTASGDFDRASVSIPSRVPAGLLRDLTKSGHDQCGKSATDAHGKWLIVKAHNAGVEGSSPSLSTNKSIG